MKHSWHLLAAVVVLSLGLGGVLSGCTENLDPLDEDSTFDPETQEPFDLAGQAMTLVVEPPDTPGGEPHVVSLVTARGLRLGNVTVNNDETYLYVTVESDRPWFLRYSKMAVATSPEAFPRPWRDRSGDLLFHSLHKLVDSFTYTIEMPQGWVESGQEVYLALTAVLYKLNNRGRPIAGRMAWADGIRFPRSGWYTYFTYTVQGGGGATCELAVSYPNGGDMLCAWQGTELLWDVVGEACGSEVRIELLQGGEVCRVIAESAPNTGSYFWPMAMQCGGAISGYSLRVTDLTSGAVDTSDATFLITDCPE
jgi:hypothetical protein